MHRLSLKHIYIIGALFHLIAAIFTEGFHRPDEHLGIMRHVGFKLDMLSFSEAFQSWEYTAKIRPWFQPFIYTYFLRPFTFLGLENPFTLSTLLRLFSSLIGFLSLIPLVKYSKEILDEKWHKICALLLMTLWFLPFFHARTTAENLGISLFLFSLPLFNQRKFFLSGLLLGLSFIVRFQMSVMIGPFILWALFIHKKSFKLLIPLIFGFLSSLVLMVIIDYWGYGELTFSPYNYFYHNIIKGAASGFGTDPWHYYLRKIVSRGIPPLSLLFLIAPLWLWIKKPLHILTWLTLPYFIVHSLISHKEVRFIFALAPFLPLIICLFLQEIEKRKKIPNWILTLLLIQNSVLLFVASAKDAYTPINFYKHLYYKKESTPIIYTLNKVRDQLHFYQKEKIEMIYIKDFSKVAEVLNQNKTAYFLTDNLKEAKLFNQYPGCQREFSTYPQFLIKSFPKIAERSKAWSLINCISP